jgi:carbon monoxide dehydrogenase subunit G
MKVTGSATLSAAPAAVFAALQDPAVLVRTIPGCQTLEETGADDYRMTIVAGVASIKGTYAGTVRLSDQQPPSSFVLHAAGQGAPGTVQADVIVSLADLGEGRTRVDYDAEAAVGGMVGGVGQRMLVGVAKKTAGEFFRAVDDVLTGAAAAPSEAAGGVPAPRTAEQPGGEAVAAGGGAVFRAPQRVARGGGGFGVGAAFGAGVTLLGVVVGWLLGRRSTH